MAERENDNPGLNYKRDIKGKAKVGEPITSEDDDQSKDLIDSPISKKRRIHEEVMKQNMDRLQDVQILHHTNNPLRPGSRILSIDNLSFSKILDTYDVLPATPFLLIDPFEATILADEPDFLDDPSPLSYEKTLLAFDEFDREFHLLLSVYKLQKYHNYKLTGGWGVFVKMHNLRAGDEIIFYKLRDDKVSKDCYYVLRYFRKPRSVTGIEKLIGNADDAQSKDKGKDEVEVKQKEGVTD